MAALELQHVTKRYGTLAANDNLSFRVQQGQIFGILGPNGAGKTTLLRLITRILLPDDGTIYFFGEPLNRHHQRCMGYVPEERGLYRHLTVLQTLCYFGQLKGLSRAECKRRAQWWLKRMDAYGWESRTIEKLSKGMSQKVQLIAALLHEPRLLVLDEPFSGLDPINQELFFEVIKELQAAGTTILLSTHTMEHAERLCDAIILLNRGRIIESGSIPEIKARYGRSWLELDFEGDSSFLDYVDGSVRILERTAHHATLQLHGGTEQAQQLIAFALRHVTLLRAEFRTPTLHEIFVDRVQHYREGPTQ